MAAEPQLWGEAWRDGRAQVEAAILRLGISGPQQAALKGAIRAASKAPPPAPVQADGVGAPVGVVWLEGAKVVLLSDPHPDDAARGHAPRSIAPWKRRCISNW